MDGSGCLFYVEPFVYLPKLVYSYNTLSLISILVQYHTKKGDFITRIFKRWLPDPEEMGMKRISVETAPEQFYCTKVRELIQA